MILMSRIGHSFVLLFSSQQTVSEAAVSFEQGEYPSGHVIVSGLTLTV